MQFNISNFKWRSWQWIVILPHSPICKVSMPYRQLCICFLFFRKAVTRMILYSALNKFQQNWKKNTSKLTLSTLQTSREDTEKWLNRHQLTGSSVCPYLLYVLLVSISETQTIWLVMVGLSFIVSLWKEFKNSWFGDQSSNAKCLPSADILLFVPHKQIFLWSLHLPKNCIMGVFAQIVWLLHVLNLSEVVRGCSS